MADNISVDFTEIERLIAARGPPGDEYPVAEVYTELIEPHVDSISYDEMGNVIATSEGKADSPEIMLAAHTDELALLVDNITDDGFLEYVILGGHYKGNFAGQQVQIGPDGITGVIGPKSRHLMSDDEKESVAENLVIDVGASSPEEVADLNIKPGDHATWDQGVTRLANNHITGRALDDRVELAILIALARDAGTDATVHYVATVQEEIGLRGARTAGFSLNPDVALALDIFPADDYPAGNPEDPTVEVGRGPVIELGDGTSEYMFGGILVDRQTQTWLLNAADTRDIEVQNAVMIRGTTDATELQQVRGGRHAGAVGVPCRYTHSPVETLSLADVNKGTQLLAEALQTPFPSREEVRHG